MLKVSLRCPSGGFRVPRCPSISKCTSVSLNDPKCPSPRGTHWTTRCPSVSLVVPQNFEVSLGVPQKYEVSLTLKDTLKWPIVPYVSFGIPQKSQVSTRGTPWTDRCPSHPSSGFRVPRCPSKLPSVQHPERHRGLCSIPEKM